MAAVLESITVPSKGRGRARGRARKVTDEREIRPGLASLTQEKGNQIISNTTEDITQKSKGFATLDLACGQDTELSMSFSAVTIKNSDSTKSSTSGVKIDQHSSICTQKEQRPRSERSRFDTLVTSQINHYLGQNNNMHASRFSSNAFRKENLDNQTVSDSTGNKGKMRGINTSIKAAHHREVMPSMQVSSRNNAQHLPHRSSPGLKLKIPPRYGSESFTDAKAELDGSLKITEHPYATTFSPSSEGERYREERPATLGNNICRLSQPSPPPDPLFKGMHDTRAVLVAGGRGRGRGRGRGYRSDIECTAHHEEVWDTDIKCPPQSEVIEQFQDAESTSGFSETVGGGLWKNKSLLSSSALAPQLSPVQTQTAFELHKNKANSETLKKPRRPRRSRRKTKEKCSEKTSFVNDIHNIDRLSLDADKWSVRHKVTEVSSTERVGLLDTTAEVGGDQSLPGLMSTPPGHIKVLDWAAEVSTPLSANPSPEWPASDQSVQSPDTLKTPPGHVKVLDWAAEMASPVSPSPCPDWGF